MNYEEANQILNNAKFGLFEPAYKVTQALIVTGDIDTFNSLEHKLIGIGFLHDIQDYKKPWVGLTDEEIQQCLNGLPTQTIDVYAKRIEKVLKDKNT
jgi:hypothetical protein